MGGKKKGNCSIILSRLDSNVISPLFWSLLDFIHLAGIESNFGNEAEARSKLFASISGKSTVTSLTDGGARKKNHLHEWWGGGGGGEKGRRNALKRTNCAEESCAHDDTAVRHVHRITKAQRR